MQELQVRPLTSEADYQAMIDYFLLSEDAFLRGMGADRQKLPERPVWLRKLLADHETDDAHKDRCYLGWIYRGELVGHSSLSKIRIGEDGYIHLHMWRPDLRKAGLGTKFFKASAAYFVQRFRLKKLLCEPRADNVAPNRVLSKLGFKLIKNYTTVPGDINFEQEVNLYELPLQ
jgi:RimJ/RimL family protein N-acetyltransferase